MSGSNLLDTNIVIALFAQDSAVAEHLEKTARYYGEIKNALRKADPSRKMTFGSQPLLFSTT